jgi:hypothetical protein
MNAGNCASLPQAGVYVIVALRQDQADRGRPSLRPRDFGIKNLELLNRRQVLNEGNGITLRTRCGFTGAWAVFPGLNLEL